MDDDIQLPLFVLQNTENGKPNQAGASNKAGAFSPYIVYVDESGGHSLRSVEEKKKIVI